MPPLSQRPVLSAAGTLAIQSARHVRSRFSTHHFMQHRSAILAFDCTAKETFCFLVNQKKSKENEQCSYHNVYCIRIPVKAKWLSNGFIVWLAFFRDMAQGPVLVGLRLALELVKSIFMLASRRWQSEQLPLRIWRKMPYLKLMAQV